MYHREKLTPEKASVNEWHAFLSNHYHQDLIDPCRVIRQELRDTAEGGYETPHAGIVLRNPESGQIFAGASGNVLPIPGYKRRDKSGKKHRIAASFLSYSAPEIGGVDNHVDVALDELAAELSGYAARMNLVMPVTFTEAEPAKTGIYKGWGFKELEGIDYFQPPLDWNKRGDQKGEAVDLQLQVKEIGDLAYELGLVSPKKCIRADLVRGFGKYLFEEWYYPEDEGRSSKAMGRIEARLEELEEAFMKSIGDKKWIPLIPSR